MTDFVRLFAQAHAGIIECPKCLTLNWYGSLVGKRGYAKRLRGGWNPFTQTLTCRNCKTPYVLGTTIWQVRQHGSATYNRAPDIVPDLRQLAVMRDLAGGGFWAEELHDHESQINRLLDGLCCCYPDGWRPECPVHKGRRPRAPEEPD